MCALASQEEMLKICVSEKAKTDLKFQDLCKLGNPTGTFNGKPTTLEILESKNPKTGKYIYKQSQRMQAQTEFTQSLICKPALFENKNIQTVFNSFATQTPLPFNKESCGFLVQKSIARDQEFAKQKEKLSDLMKFTPHIQALFERGFDPINFETDVDKNDEENSAEGIKAQKAALAQEEKDINEEKKACDKTV